MKRRRHTPEQIVRKLREADKMLADGIEVPEVCKALGVSEATYHRWRAQFGGMKADDVKRLKELERENSQLKRLVADKELEKPGAAGDLEGKLVSPSRLDALRSSCSKTGWASRSAGRARLPGSTAQPSAVSVSSPRTTRLCGHAFASFPASGHGKGYRRAHADLLGEGWQINRKRVQRIWREEGLRVPQRRRKRQRLGASTVPASRLRAERPDHVWAFDFQFDQTADGHILKLLHVVDEFTREALAIRCERRIDSDATVAVLERLTASRGRAPEFIRCDNGPEMTANALKDWCHFAGTGSSYIDPGSPWQNPYVESFGSRVRDELLAVEQFSCLAEAKVLIEDWREDYNEHRPHSALGMKSPAQFARAYRAQRDDDTPTLQQNNTQRLSQQMDR